VSPSRRRGAVCMLQDRLAISERRACRILGQSRSSQRREPVVAQDDAALRLELRAFSRTRPRWGYRQAHQHLLDAGWSVNRKRVQRLWREEGLRVPPKRRKRQRRGQSTVPGDRLRAERPDHVWAFDFQFDVTDDGRAVKLLYVVDEFTREALAMEAERSIDADRVVNVLDQIIHHRGSRPELLRCDNGPEMTSAALRDWCRFSRTGAAFIEPGSPWENPFVESFNSRVRDELLSGEVFSCLAEVKVMVDDFREDYNRCRPHRAHGMMTPAAFKTGWETAHEAARASAELRCRVAGTVARPGSHRTVLVLFTHGSSGRRVANPAAGRYPRPCAIPTPSPTARGWRQRSPRAKHGAAPPARADRGR
jgi:putative transposase